MVSAILSRDQQEPIRQQSAFLRLDWQDAFVRDIGLTALVSIDLQDGSGFMQASAAYHVSRVWTLDGLIGGSYGGRQSNYGSVPVVETLLLRTTRYF